MTTSQVKDVVTVSLITWTTYWPFEA